MHLSGGTCPGSILPFTLTCNFRYWERERLIGLRNSLKATFQDTLNGGSQLCTDSDCWEGRLAAHQPTTLASPSPHYPRPGEAEGWGRTLATRHREIVQLAPGHTACKRQRAIAPNLGAAPYPSPLLSTLTAPTPVEEATAETQGRFMARTACVAALWSSGGGGDRQTPGAAVGDSPQHPHRARLECGTTVFSSRCCASDVPPSHYPDPTLP